MRMKKLFTLIAVALMATSVSADEVTLWEGSLKCDNWSAQGLLSDAGLELKDAGAQPGDKLKLYADLSSATEGWQLQVVEGHWDKDAEGNPVLYAAFTQANGDFADGTATFELTEACLTRAFTKSWWGNSFLLNGTGGLVITKAALVRPVSYSTEGKAVNFDASSGFIAASEFAGLHERSKVVFTYNVAADPADKAGWGIGRIGSNDDTGSGPSVLVAEIPAKGIGEQTVTVLVSDINKALVATPDGILWNLWGLEGIPATRVKAEIFVATEDTPSGVKAVKAVKADNGALYNLAGQKVNDSYKGVVIMNGKKIVMK